MEILITLAYVTFIRLFFFEFHILKYTLVWKLITLGIWVLAVLTEVLFLGQFTPYTKEMFVQSYVVQMAPNLGGEVTDVYVEANQPVKKGDPLFSMDPTIEKNKVQLLEAQLAAANTEVAELNQKVAQAEAAVHQVESDLRETRAEYDMISAAAEKKAASQVRLDETKRRVLALEAQLEGTRAELRQAQLSMESEINGTHTSIAEVIAELATARYNLKHTTVYAPSDGYAVNMQLHPGAFIRIKTPVMTFVSTEEFWMIGRVLQQGSKYIQSGDDAEVTFRTYPGKIFKAKVSEVVYGSGNAQGIPSGVIPHIEQVAPSLFYFVRLKLTEDNPDYPLRFGASGLAAIYTNDAADYLKVVRKIELRAESFLFYVFNPF